MINADKKKEMKNLSEMLLETRNLTKQYGHHKAVDSVNMHIKKRCYLWFYRSEWSWEDNLSEDDQWAFQANLWRNRDVRIQGKGFEKSSITDRMSD